MFDSDHEWACKVSAQVCEYVYEFVHVGVCVSIYERVNMCMCMSVRAHTPA